MIRIGIAGCGEIAKKHISFIKQIGEAEIVGLVDKNPQALEKIAQKYNISSTYTDIGSFLEHKKPDVIHVLTPPQYHKDVALAAINAGTSLYIEKPLALNHGETKTIIENAFDKGVSVCAGFNHLFDPCMQKANRLVQEGKIGDIVYLESYYGMNVLRGDLRQTTADNHIHWSYNLPGGLFHNYIDHPLYLLLNYLGRPEALNVTSQSSGILPQNLTDELHVVIEGKRATGLLVISFGVKPQLHYLNIYGRKGIIKVNFDTMTTVYHGLSALPKAASKATFNLNEAYQLSRDTFSNAANLLRGKLKPYQGMKNLIGSYHSSLLEKLPSPIDDNLMLNTSATIDDIWRQAKNLHLNHQSRPSQQKSIKKKAKILVTGASGFVGVAMVKSLVEDGYQVRALVRKLSYLSDLEKLGVEICFGDIRDKHSFSQAVAGVDVIIHLAADTSGNATSSVPVTVEGTRNLIDLAQEHAVKRVIYMSSMSVYDTVHAKNGQVFNEQAPLEPQPVRRGAYALSKKIAEDLVRPLLQDTDSKWTVLRPAMIFGPGSDMFFGPIGLSLANRMIIMFGGGHTKLRLVHVEDVTAAVQLCLSNDLSRGKIYNVVHDEMLPKKEYLEKFFCRNRKKIRVVSFPYKFLMACTWLQEMTFKLARRKPILTCYRLAASQREVNFDTSSLRNDLDWRPVRPIRDQLHSAIQ